MCVIYLAYQQHAEFRLILIANRDEYYSRPSAAAAFWKDHPDIYAGRDLVGGGTWLGVTRDGRFAAVTNYRDPSAPAGVRSRGDLAADYLKTKSSPREYLEQIRKNQDEFSGFNLLFGTTDELYYFSNRGGNPQKLTPGVYGLSNHLLDTPWPKVTNGKAALSTLLASKEPTSENLLAILADETLAPDDQLPSTGISYEAEKAISAIFIKTEGYGTRCSTVLRINKENEWSFDEKVFV